MLSEVSLGVSGISAFILLDTLPLTKEVRQMGFIGYYGRSKDFYIVND